MTKGSSRRQRWRAAALLLLVAAIAYLLFDDAAITPPATPTSPLLAEATAVAAPVRAEEAVNTPRQADESAQPVAAPAAPPAVDLELPHEFKLRIVVRDADGLPLEGVQVFAALPRCAFGLIPHATDARGELHFSCRGRQATLTLWIATMAFGVTSPLRTITMLADVESTIAFGIPARESDPHQLLQLLLGGLSRRQIQAARAMLKTGDENHGGGSLPRFLQDSIVCGRELWMFQVYECTACHEPSRLVSYRPLQWAPRLYASTTIPALFHDLLLTQPESSDRQAKEEELRRRAGRASTEEEGTIFGTVTTARGQPAGGAQVAWIDGDGALRERVTANADGLYHISLPVGRRCDLVASCGALGRAETTTAAAAKGAGRADFQLQTFDLVHGTAVDDQDRGLSDWHVWFVGEDRPQTAVGRTAADGTFALAGTDGPGRCFLVPQDQSLRLPVLRTEPVSSAQGALRLRLDRMHAAGSRLRFRPHLPSGFGKARVEFRLEQLDGGFGTHLEIADYGDVCEIKGLAAGGYRGEIGAQGLGWVEISRVDVDGLGMFDIGPIDLPLPGRVRFLHVPSKKTIAELGVLFVQRRIDCNVMQSPTRLGAETVALPAGDYAIVYRDKNAVRTAGVTVRSGEMTTIEWPFP